MADHDYTHIFIFQDLFQLTDLKLWAEMSASSLCEKNFYQSAFSIFNNLSKMWMSWPLQWGKLEQLAFFAVGVFTQAIPSLKQLVSLKPLF